MALSIHELKLAYREKLIITNTSLSFKRGEISCLIGPNGCGKSTLLQALGGLLLPQSGTVTLDNKPLKAWPRKALARRLTLLPQAPVAPDSLSVQQLVSHGRYPYQGLFGKTSQADIEAVELALQLTNMSALRYREFNTLSGGERQRGWIALALAQQSDILLLDEPTTYLDIGSQLEVLELLAKLHKQHQLTLVMVLHDINQASQYADRILAMQDGHIIADGKPLEVISETLLETLFGVSMERIIRKQDKKPYPYCLPLGSAAIHDLTTEQTPKITTHKRL